MFNFSQWSKHPTKLEASLTPEEGGNGSKFNIKSRARENASQHYV